MFVFTNHYFAGFLKDVYCYLQILFSDYIPSSI